MAITDTYWTKPDAHHPDREINKRWGTSSGKRDVRDDNGHYLKFRSDKSAERRRLKREKPEGISLKSWLEKREQND